MKLAAIDIGSNAARLLITDVIPGPQNIPDFIKVALVRVPLRLGFEVFDKGEISSAKVEKIIKTIKSYKLLLEVYEVKHLKACATSAMRDAVNSKDIIKKVKAETGIEIEIISENSCLVVDSRVDPKQFRSTPITVENYPMPFDVQQRYPQYFASATSTPRK